MKTIEKIQSIEERFKNVCGIDADLSQYPIKDNVQFATNKEKSRDFAEVFTPLHIVDQMISIVPFLDINAKSIDLCSGMGQFTVREIRARFEEIDEFFDVDEYLKNKHLFSELQISSCCKLLWIFGIKIHLAIGDVLQLAKLPREAKGIWLYVENMNKWVNVTTLVKSIFAEAFNDKKKKIEYNYNRENIFVEAVSKIITKFNHICKGDSVLKSDFEQLLKTPKGREEAIRIITENATINKKNWQDKATPDWLVREMINCVPDVNDLKKILVMFNIEFLECLIKEKGIDPSVVNFAFDNELEGKFAKKVYGVDGFSIGSDIDMFKSATQGIDGIEGRYDLVLSNPPYQVNDSGHGASAQPIYNKIVEYTIDYLKPEYICIITPSRWIAGGKGLKSYRERMLKDKRIQKIIDFSGSKEIFKDADIKGGVSYFLWNKNYNGLCNYNGSMRNIDQFDIMIRDVVSVDIINKIFKNHSNFCNNKVCGRNPFGIDTNFNNWNNNTNSIKCYCKNNKINNSIIYTDRNNILNKYKICTTKSTGLNSFGKFDKYICTFIAEPNSICTDTYIVVDSFNTKKEAENYILYMNTRFYRFMLSLRVISQDINKEKFAFVPGMQDYNHIYTDEDLYNHFELTKKEIEHIEKSIKV